MASMGDFDFDYAELEDNDAIKREYTGYSGGLVRLKKGEFFYSHYCSFCSHFSDEAVIQL